MEELTAYFGAYIPLRQAEEQAIAALFVNRTLKRRQFVLQPDELCQHYTFVAAGCLKMYYTDPNGSDHNLQFAADNDRPEDRWMADIGSLHATKKSQLAIEASTILQIEKPNLVYLYHHFPKFDRIFRVITENKLVEFQNRILQTISSTAQQRYQTFLDQYPNLARRLPNSQIAAYLGVTPEFLSRLRRRVLEQERSSTPVKPIS